MKTKSLAKRNLSKTLIELITHDHSLLEAIHSVAGQKHSMSLLPEQVQSLSNYIKAATLLGHSCIAMSDLEEETKACVKEEIAWFNTDLERPEGEEIVMVRDTHGNISQGFYNEMGDFWQARFPNALKSVPTHWARIGGPDAIAPLNAANGKN